MFSDEYYYYYIVDLLCVQSWLMLVNLNSRLRAIVSEGHGQGPYIVTICYGQGHYIVTI